MLILAHRGYHRDAAENSLAAFEAAISYGCSGLETDVQLSRDGQIVLIHDRVVNGKPVEEMTRAELARDIGHPVPTLQEALELAASDDFLWNIEIKAPQALGPALSVLKPYTDRRRLLLTSFWHPVVVQAAERAGVPVGLLFAHRPILTPRRPEWLPTTPLLQALVWFYDCTDSELVAATRAWALECFVYSPLTPVDHARCVAWQPDAVITDHPELVRSAR